MLNSNMLNKQRGSEVLQVLLITGVFLVIIVTLFYPQMQALFNMVLDTITNWFTSRSTSIFN